MAGLANVVADGNILGLVERFLRAGVIEDGVFKPTTVGTPQGGVISPLLANIALNSLDWLLDRQGMRIKRYADDFVVMCHSHTQAEEALALVQSHLSDELGLKLSPEKTQFARFEEGLSWLRPMLSLGDHAGQIGRKVQSQNPGNYQTLPQS